MRNIDIVNELAQVTLVITKKYSDHVFADGKPIYSKIFSGHWPEINDLYFSNSWEGNLDEIKRIVEQSQEIELYQHHEGDNFTRLKYSKDDEGKWSKVLSTLSLCTFDYYQGVFHSAKGGMAQDLNAFDFDYFATFCIQDNPSSAVLRKFLLSIDDPSLGITPNDIRKLNAEHLLALRKLQDYFFATDKEDYSRVIVNLLELVQSRNS